MDIEQIRQAKHEMENAIEAAVSKELTAFIEKTGTSPHSINIQLVELSILGTINPRYIVGKVSADISV